MPPSKAVSQTAEGPTTEGRRGVGSRPSGRREVQKYRQGWHRRDQTPTESQPGSPAKEAPRQGHQVRNRFTSSDHPRTGPPSGGGTAGGPPASTVLTVRAITAAQGVQMDRSRTTVLAVLLMAASAGATACGGGDPDNRSGTGLNYRGTFYSLSSLEVARDRWGASSTGRCRSRTPGSTCGRVRGVDPSRAVAGYTRTYPGTGSPEPTAWLLLSRTPPWPPTRGPTPRCARSCSTRSAADGSRLGRL